MCCTTVAEANVASELTGCRLRPARERAADFMTVSTAARMALAGFVISACALGAAAPSNAEPGPCDPMSRSMMPHQPSECDAPPPPDVLGPDGADGIAVPAPGDPVLPPPPQFEP